MNTNNEWNSPRRVIRKVKKVLGEIDVDPASNNKAQKIIKAKQFYTIEDNGLKHIWRGTVYLNPPYSQKLLKQFLLKLDKDFKAGYITEFILLTNSGTDTLWNNIISKYLQAYTLGRICFVSNMGLPSKGNGRGQCFTYGGPNPDKFISEFTKNDFCWIPNISYFN